MAWVSRAPAVLRLLVVVRGGVLLLIHKREELGIFGRREVHILI